MQCIGDVDIITGHIAAVHQIQSQNVSLLTRHIHCCIHYSYKVTGTINLSNKAREQMT